MQQVVSVSSINGKGRAFENGRKLDKVLIEYIKFFINSHPEMTDYEVIIFPFQLTQLKSTELMMQKQQFKEEPHFQKKQLPNLCAHSLSNHLIKYQHSFFGKFNIYSNICVIFQYPHPKFQKSRPSI